MKHLQAVNLSLIRYANCWEDARLLLAALPDAAGKRISIVASAGDNALALLTKFPEKITAFDVSLPQLHLTELKKAAFATLDYEDLLQFLGVRATTGKKRMSFYQQIQNQLSPEAKAFWDNRPEDIHNGVNHSGKFERYFRLFRRYGLPLVHSKKSVAALLSPKDDAAQKAFYHNHWNSWRWKLLMAIFFSKWVMGRAGRDPKFLEQVRVPVSQFIRQKAEAHLQSADATQNPFLHFIFTGNYGDTLPEYLLPGKYDTIKSNLDRLTIQQGSADNIVAAGESDVLCLSNIFEYFPDAAFSGTVKNWKETLPSGTRLLYWNLMVPRHFSEAAPDAFERLRFPEIPGDNGFFYADFVAEQKR